MLITEKVRTVLKQVDTCSACGASWAEMEKSLAEGIQSDNCLYALFIIRNCKLCMTRFQDEYNRLKGGN